MSSNYAGRSDDMGRMKLSRPSIAPSVKTTNMTRRQLIRAGLLVATLLSVWLLLARRGDSEDDHDGYDYSVFSGRKAGQGAAAGLASSLYGRSDKRSRFRKGSDNVWIDLTHNVPWTTNDGSLEGYTVWSNLYLSGGTLIAVSQNESDSKALPPARSIMSSHSRVNEHNFAAGSDRWTTLVGEDLVHAMFGDKALRLPGVIYIFNDPPGHEGFIAYHSHFVIELLTPAARAVASAREAKGQSIDEDMLPTRIIFPRCGEKPSWRDDQNLNYWLLQNMFPGVTIEDAATWRDRAGGDHAYIFDQVVIVDRWAAHAAGRDAEFMAKMNGNVPSLAAPKHFWDPFHLSLQRSVGNPFPHIGKYKKPVIVYLQENTRPRISPESSAAIVEGLKKLTDRAEIHVSQLRSMNRDQKVALLSRANLVIALNGGGDLAHIIYMRGGEGNGVIELFEEGGFVHDMSLLSAQINLNHEVIQGKRLLPPNKWRGQPRGQRGPQKDGEVDIGAPAVLQAVERWLDLRAQEL